MFVISFNICLFIYFSVKYAIQSNDCDVFVNKQSIYHLSISIVWQRYHLKGKITQRQEIGKNFSADPLAFNTNLNLIES